MDTEDGESIGDNVFKDKRGHLYWKSLSEPIKDLARVLHRPFYKAGYIYVRPESVAWDQILSFVADLRQYAEHYSHFQPFDCCYAILISKNQLVGQHRKSNELDCLFLPKPLETRSSAKLSVNLAFQYMAKSLKRRVNSATGEDWIAIPRICTDLTSELHSELLRHCHSKNPRRVAKKLIQLHAYSDDGSDSEYEFRNITDKPIHHQPPPEKVTEKVDKATQLDFPLDKTDIAKLFYHPYNSNWGIPVDKTLVDQ